MTHRSMGIDVSGWQKNSDFKKAREAGIDFCFVKSTDGRTGVNKLFEEQLKGCREAGIIVGPYHYAQLERASGETIDYDATMEADRLVDIHEKYFLDDIDPLPSQIRTGADGRSIIMRERKTVNLPLVLDLEDIEGHTLTDVEVLRWLACFIYEVATRLGYPPIVYTGTGFVSRYAALLKDPALADIPLWMAKYPAAGAGFVDHPLTPGRFEASVKPWRDLEWLFWQYGGHPTANKLNTCPGINGLCDRNVFNGDRRSLLTWIDYHKGLAP